jgi:peroxiredoxin
LLAALPGFVAAQEVLPDLTHQLTALKPRPPAPDFTLKDLDGKTQRLSDYKGKVVLVNFWATSCAVCLKEMPRLAELHERYAARGLETIAVAMPYDPPNRVVAYQRDKRLPFKVAIDPNGEAARRFDDVRVTPTTFLIDRRGRIVARYVGEPDFAEVAKLIEGALARG